MAKIRDENLPENFISTAVGENFARMYSRSIKR
jgi:hypothetical protein